MTYSNVLLVYNLTWSLNQIKLFAPLKRHWENHVIFKILATFHILVHIVISFYNNFVASQNVLSFQKFHDLLFFSSHTMKLVILVPLFHFSASLVHLSNWLSIFLKLHFPVWVFLSFHESPLLFVCLLLRSLFLKKKYFY